MKAAPPVTAQYHTILLRHWNIFANTACARIARAFLGRVCPLNDKRALKTCALLLLCANGILGLSFFFYSPPPRSLTSFISVIPYKQDVGYTHTDKWWKKSKCSNSLASY